MKTLLLIAILFAGVSYQVETLPAYRCAAQEKQPANDQSSTSAKQQPLADQKAASRSGDAEASADKIKKSEWIAIGINSFIALVILWQAWIYNQQRKLMKRQVDALAVSERAYLGIKTIGISGLIVGQRPVISAIIQNYGRTPAWKVKAPALVSLELPGKRPSGDIETKYPGEGVLAAGDTRKAEYIVPGVCDAKIVEGIETGQAVLFVRAPFITRTRGDLNKPTHSPSLGTLSARRLSITAKGNIT